MNEQKKNNGKGIFYGVIGVATLVVAIIGATFAYFTATANAGENVITGNMATITFDLEVTKVTHVDETKGGMIPMSNNMVGVAVDDANNASQQVCVDDNGNAVCQVYRVDVRNTGTASLFVDGYVVLTGGSGAPTDVLTTGNDQPKWTNIQDATAYTTMRWAQVFCTAGDASNEADGCSTAGTSTVGSSDTVSIAAISGTSGTGDAAAIAAARHNRTNILTTYAAATGSATISGNSYPVINKNYIRISDHAASQSSETDRLDRNTDITSALVFNQYLQPKGASGANATLYFVVWLSETGTNQTATTTGAGTPANSGLSFFNGKVSFNSAQGSEVTATFSSYAAVVSDQASVATPATP